MNNQTSLNRHRHPWIREWKVCCTRKNHSSKGLKILTPDKKLSRLPSSLAQLKEGNNPEKVKNKIRQLFNSKAISKLYKNGNNLYELWK